MRRIAFILAIGFAATAYAEGPGSQVRTTPQVPLATPMPTDAPTQDQKRCDALSAERRQQCLADLRSPTPQSTGPQSIGGGAGAASGAASGTTGGGTFGGSAPR